MNLPPVDNPIWKLAQTIASIVLVALLIYHSHHSGGVDLSDAGGLLGGGILSKLAVQFFIRKG